MRAAAKLSTYSFICCLFREIFVQTMHIHAELQRRTHPEGLRAALALQICHPASTPDVSDPDTELQSEEERPTGQHAQ